MGNPERRDASLLAAPLRTRSRGVISTIRRHPGRCNGIGNLFQRRVIHPSRHAAVAGIGDRSVGSGKKQAGRDQRSRLQLNKLMLSIQKIFGRDEKFYNLLEQSAEEADASVHHLIALLERLEQHESPQSLEQFILSRRKDKEITQELTEQLCKTFITPLEREDIQALAADLYKIPKTVEKIGERIVIFPGELHGRSFTKHLELLDQAAETVLAMVKQLRKGTDAATAREKNARLQTIEGDADKLELELLHDLYHGSYDAKQIVFLRDLYDLLEKVIDRCRDAGNIILQVVLKHS